MKTAFFLFFLFYSLVSLVQTALATDNSKEWIKIYKYNTDLESCDPTTSDLHDAPHTMQKILNSHEVLVRSSFRGHDGLMYPLNQLNCGRMPTISIFEVPAESYDKVRSLGFRACQILEEKGGGCYPEFYSDRILPDKNQAVRRVYKHTGHKQCQEGSGVELPAMEQELIEVKIVVFQRYKGVDGLLYPLSCGYETGEINIYVIEKSALAQALSLGYRECAYLEEIGGVCHYLPIRRSRDQLSQLQKQERK